MRTNKVTAVACICFVFVMLFSAATVQAGECCIFNPLLIPFAVAGAVLGTAAAIVTAPFQPYPVYSGPAYAYYPPPPYRPGPRYAPDRAWVPGHRGPYGEWIPGHWRRAGRWVPGHHNYYGYWVPGHWR